MSTRHAPPVSFAPVLLALLLAATPSGGAAAVVESVGRREAWSVVAVDGAGHVYEAFSQGSPGSYAPLVARKWAPDGSLIYETQLGTGFLGGISPDASGNLFLVGASDHGVPDVRPIPGVANGRPCHWSDEKLTSCGNAFLIELDPSGRVVLSTELGGSMGQHASAVAIGPSGTVQVVGVTSSADFPAARTFGHGIVGPVACGASSTGTSMCPLDVFVAAIDPSGPALLHSVVLAGSGDDFPHAVAVDASGNSWITGSASSSDFPLLEATHAAGRGFVAKIDPTGTPLFSTYLGATLVGSAIAVSSSGEALVAGYDDPGWDSFVRRLDGAGREIATVVIESLLATNVTGNPTVITSLAQDAAGNAYVAGYTQSLDLPVVDAVQGASAGGLDAFVTKFSPSGAIVQSTYLGGSGSDLATAVAVDSQGVLYVAGVSFSADFPMLDGPGPMPSGAGDGFLVTIGEGPSPSGIRWAPAMLDFSAPVGATATTSLVVTNASASPIDVGSIGMAGTPPYFSAPYFVPSSDCTVTLAPGAVCTVQVTFSSPYPGVIPGLLQIGDGAGSPRVSLVARAIQVGQASMRLTPRTTPGHAAPGTVAVTGIVRAQNVGTEPLVIARIAPPAGFAAESDCPPRLETLRTCSIRIDFAPAATGEFRGYLGIESNDPEGGGVQSWILLEGVGEDFALTASAPSATVAAGASATYSLGATRGGTDPDAQLFVALACGDLPAGATCAFQDAGLAVGSGTTMTTLVIETTAATTPSSRAASGLAGSALAGLALIAAHPRRGRRSAWLVIASILVYGACTDGGPSAPGGTPPGTYDVVVTGRSGTLERTTALTLVVQ